MLCHNSYIMICNNNFNLPVYYFFFVIKRIIFSTNNKYTYTYTYFFNTLLITIFLLYTKLCILYHWILNCNISFIVRRFIFSSRRVLHCKNVFFANLSIRKRMYICLSFNIPVRPIVMKLWEVVECTPAKVPSILHPILCTLG